MHISGLNRKQRREAVHILLAMRSIYPGDINNSLYRDAMKLDKRLPPMQNVTVTDEPSKFSS